MKKIRSGLVLLVLATFTVMPAAAKKAKKIEPAARSAVIIDYQGQKEGKEMPAWFQAAASGNEKAIAKALGLADTAMVYFCIETAGDMAEALTLGKIDAYSAFVGTLMSRLEQTENTLSSRSLGTYKRDEAATYGLQLQYTPFGFSFYFSEPDSAAKRIVLDKILYPDYGKKEAYKAFFSWCQDPKNIRIDQFWMELKQPSGEIEYKSSTVLSLEGETYKKLLAEAMSGTILGIPVDDFFPAAQ